jgi:hypothetical protein
MGFLWSHNPSSCDFAHYGFGYFKNSKNLQFVTTVLTKYPHKHVGCPFSFYFENDVSLISQHWFSDFSENISYEAQRKNCSRYKSSVGRVLGSKGKKKNSGVRSWVLVTQTRVDIILLKLAQESYRGEKMFC